MPGDRAAWLSFMKEDFGLIAARCRGADIRCGDGLSLFAEARPDWLMYVDPPYLIETRKALDTYKHEVTKKQRDKQKRIEQDRLWHMGLLKLILDCPAKIILSGYESELYDRTLKGWEKHKVEIANHSGQGRVKERRTEVIYVRR